MSLTTVATQMATSSSMCWASANASLALLAHEKSADTSSDLSTRDQEGGLIFQPEIKPLFYVLGMKVAALAQRMYCLLPSLPSFSLPVVAAEASGCGELVPCPVPKGRYVDSCDRPRVAPSSDGECVLTTRCGTMYDGLAHQPARWTFSRFEPHVSLKNHNGTLALEDEDLRDPENPSPVSTSVTAALEPGDAGFLDPENPSPVSTSMTTTVRTGGASGAKPSDIEREVRMGAVTSGEIVGVKSNGMPEVASAEEWLKANEEFTSYQSMAHKTGGIVGVSRSATSFVPLMENIFMHILRDLDPGTSLDVGFVVDSTGSMGPYLEKAKDFLMRFVSQLQTSRRGSAVRAGLIEYRDRESSFVSRVGIGLTSRLSAVQSMIQDLTAEGGGDVAEAALDALLMASRDLAWDRGATRRVVILITDAPARDRTVDGNYGMDYVIDQYRRHGAQIIMYPILSLVS